jgi:hypothetical protein
MAAAPFNCPAVCQKHKVFSLKETISLKVETKLKVNSASKFCFDQTSQLGHGE